MTQKKPDKKIPQKLRDAYALVGKIGGKATAKKLGKKGMAELGRRGANKRWGNPSDKIESEKVDDDI